MAEIVKGFRDIEDASKRILIRNIIEDVFKKYCFIPVETPVIEYEEFVKGNNENDEAVSDIFKLEDRGKRKLALRYEFTFQLKRLAKNKKLPFRRYQIGYVFRDEPTSGNRWRQFTQCDADIVGSTEKEEAEILKIASEILEKLGIEFVIKINNRKLLNEIIEKEGIKEKESVIREIDKLDKISEEEVRKNLEKFKAERVLDITKKPADFFEKYDAYKEILSFKKACELYNVKVEFVPFLARGLSYYTGTIFEIKSKLKEVIVAGGSYLVNGIKSTGISFGLDRLEILASIQEKKNNLLIISINQEKEAIKLAEALRKEGIACNVYYDKVTKGLDYANSYSIPYVLFVGEEEVKAKKFKLRDMKSGKEKMLNAEKICEEILKKN